MNIWKTIKRVLGALVAALRWCVKATWKALLVLLLLGYVVIGAGGVKNVVMRELNLRHNVAYLETVITNAVFNNTLENVSFWMRQRPLEETEAMVRIVTPHSADLPPMVFLELSRRLSEQAQKEEATFWYLLARYRLRYDFLRCGAVTAIVNFDNLVSMLEPPALKALGKDEVLMKRGITEVLAFDKKYPPENTMDYACAMVQLIQGDAHYVPISQDLWPSVRQSLRDSAQGYVDGVK